MLVTSSCGIDFSADDILLVQDATLGHMSNIRRTHTASALSLHAVYGVDNWYRLFNMCFIAAAKFQCKLFTQRLHTWLLVFSVVSLHWTVPVGIAFAENMSHDVLQSMVQPAYYWHAGCVAGSADHAGQERADAQSPGAAGHCQVTLQTLDCFIDILKLPFLQDKWARQRSPKTYL